MLITDSIILCYPMENYLGKQTSKKFGEDIRLLSNQIDKATSKAADRRRVLLSLLDLAACKLCKPQYVVDVKASGPAQRSSARSPLGACEAICLVLGVNDLPNGELFDLKASPSDTIYRFQTSPAY